MDDLTTFFNDNLPFILAGGFFFWFFFLRGGDLSSKVASDLYLDKYTFDPRKRRGVIVEIRGRKSGFWGWLLGLIGLNRQSYIIVTEKEVRFHFTGISDQTTYTAPLNTVTCFLSGREKPVFRAIIGGVLIVGSILGMLSGFAISFLGLIIGGAFLLSYALTTQLTLAFSTGDLSANYGLNFRTKTRGGNKLTTETLDEMISHVNKVFRYAERQGEVKDIQDDLAYDDIMGTPETPAANAPMLEDLNIDIDDILNDLNDEDDMIEPINIEQAHEKGIQQGKQRDFQGAIGSFTIVINRAPVGSSLYLDALQKRASCYRQVGNEAGYQADRAEWKKYNNAGAN